MGLLDDAAMPGDKTDYAKLNRQLETARSSVAGFTGIGQEPSVMNSDAVDAYRNAELAGLLSDVVPGKAMFGAALSMNAIGKKKLADILGKLSSGEKTGTKIRDAIDLTDSQRKAFDGLLGENYKAIKTPQSIPYMVQHSFDSRVKKDGFGADDVYNWSIAAADDASVPFKGSKGAALINTYVDPKRNMTYKVEMPVRGDALGNVWADDVIPRGLFGPNSPPKTKPSKASSPANQGSLPQDDTASRVASNIDQETQQVKRQLTEFEQRHLTAQKNAALPLEQGGLGLPIDNTAMDRAKALGYEIPVFHGSYSDFQVIDPEKFRGNVQYMPGFFTADKSELAGNFGDIVYPLLQKRGYSMKEKISDRRAGIPVESIDSIHDSANGIHVTNDPSNIRSRFAAFDPMRRNEADILGYADPQLLSLMAGGSVAGLAGYGLLNYGQQTK